MSPLDRAVALAEMDACAAASKRTWTSTWRGPATNRSRIRRSSPNAALASRRAAARAAGSSSSDRDGPHPLATAAGGRLDEERDADLRGRGGKRLVVLLRRRRSRARSGRRGRARACARPPCRPSSGSPRAAARPSGSRRPGRPRRTAALSARNPKPGWSASAPACRAAATTCSTDSRSTASGPSVWGTTARMPEPIGRPRDPRRDLAAIGDEEGADRLVGDPSPRPFAQRTRQSRQLRHANVPRRAGLAAVPRRSSAGRSSSSPRSGPQPPAG